MRRQQQEDHLTSDDQIPLDGLHQSQGVDLHRTAFPLLDVGAVRVSLQLTLQLVRVKELECLRAPEDEDSETCQTEQQLERSEQNVGEPADLLPLPLPLGKSCTLTGNCSIWLRQLFILCTRARYGPFSDESRRPRGSIPGTCKPNRRKTYKQNLRDVDCSHCCSVCVSR